MRAKYLVNGHDRLLIRLAGWPGDFRMVAQAWVNSLVEADCQIFGGQFEIAGELAQGFHWRIKQLFICGKDPAETTGCAFAFQYLHGPKRKAVAEGEMIPLA